MKLPQAAHAVIDPAKLRDYLLSSSHPLGRFKARFFVGLGFSPEDWQALRDALIHHAQVGVAAELENYEYGRRFAVTGELAAPAGRKAAVVSVWIILEHEVVPRFVTAFPGKP